MSIRIEGDFLKTIGMIIKEYREEKNLTQDKLAEKIGWTRMYLGRIENDKIKPNDITLMRISKATGLDFQYLKESTQK
jgi:transcriptional regulator with XRE-family HTH domain